MFFEGSSLETTIYIPFTTTSKRWKSDDPKDPAMNLNY
jgi:hypothetical protein